MNTVKNSDENLLSQLGETLKFEFLSPAKNGFKVGLLSINRPSKYNSLNTQVLKDLNAFIEMAHTSSLSALIVTGEGDKAFIAGADILEMSEMNAKQGHQFGELGQAVTKGFEALPFPVIAAVNGHALGGGCEMAISMDLILASQNASFGQPEVKLGLIPGFGGTQRLAKLIGRQKAKELIFTGQTIKAQEAYELGLILKVLPDKESLLAECLNLAHKILENSPKAVALAKSCMNKANDLTIPEGLAAELELFGDIFSSYDQKEGTKAFVEKRSPLFRGE